MTWVEPKLVAQVGFTEWTRDGRLRHPRFLGLRFDKAGARGGAGGMTETIRIGRRDVRVTHPDKVLFPRARVTKLDLARHYERVAPVMLPVRGRAAARAPGVPGRHRRARASSMKNGAARTSPTGSHRATVPKRGGTITHALADDAATLVYLAGQNVVTPHIWLSRADEPRKPDRLILDFDPSGGGFADVRAAARDAGERLRDAGLVPYAMVTGSRGVHVVCPLRRGPGFGDVHGFARGDGGGDGGRRPAPPHARMEEGGARHADLRGREPQRLRPARGGALRGAAQAARAGGGARSTGRSSPTRRCKPDRWTVKTIGERIDSEGDPWKGMGRRARALPA